MSRIPVYVINDFLKFERKLYSLFGINLGRSIQFKTISYFVAAFSFIFIASFIPILGFPFAAMPILVKIGTAGGIAYLLTDVGTENRPPLNAFVSFARYHLQSSKSQSFYKGNILMDPKPVQFTRPPFVREKTFKELEVPKEPVPGMLRLPAPEE